MTPDLAFEEETLWRNLQAPTWPVPFIECADTLACVTRCTGRLDVRAVQEGVAAIIQRHRVLQSRYPVRDGTAVRSTAPMQDDPVRVLDLREWPEREREQHAAALANTELCRTFDIPNGPLFRVALMTLDDHQHVLAFTAHHLVFDGRSAGVIRREIRAHLGAEPALAHATAAPYSDYVAWQRRELAGARLARLREFWMRRLDGLVDRRLARTGPHRLESTRSKFVRFGVSDEDSEAMRRLSRERGVTIATTLLALLTIVLHELTDSTDVVVGIPVSCRPTHVFEHTVGLFINAVAIRTDLSQEAAFADLQRRMWSTVLDAYQHRAFPLEQLVDALGARTGHGPPPFRVVFNFSPASPPDRALPSLLSDDMAALREPPSLADVSLHVRDSGGSLDCCLLYKADLLSQAQIDDMASRFRRLARQVSLNPYRTIGELVRSQRAEVSAE